MDYRSVPNHYRLALPLYDILFDIIVRGIRLAFIRGYALCVDGCAHWHKPVGWLSADLGMIGEHVHLEHFSCVGVAWPDAWLMGLCHHVNAARAITFITCCIAWLPFDMDCGMKLTLDSYEWELGSR